MTNKNDPEHFKQWMLQRGLSLSTAEKYAGAIFGPLSDWGVATGVLQEPLGSLYSISAFREASSTLSQQDIFVERNTRGHQMYSSALKQFDLYLEAALSESVTVDIKNVLDDPDIGKTQKEALIQARLGQGVFRKRLLEYWNSRCAVTGYLGVEMLVASHIKPWSQSSDLERLDPFNGLLLIPNIDRAFDKGFISFDEAGTLLISPLLTNPEMLGIQTDFRITLEDRHQTFMAYHRKTVFKRRKPR